VFSVSPDARRQIGGGKMIEEEAREVIKTGRKVRISLGARVYEGNLFLGDSSSFRFLGSRVDKPSEEIVAIVPFTEILKVEAV